MKILNLFLIPIAIISTTSFASPSRAETNTKTYDKLESQQIAQRTRRARRISYRIPPGARAKNRSRIITARGTATRTINGVTSVANFQTILAPDHVTNTISSHPTFAVYFPEAGGDFVVSLEEKGTRFNKTIWEQNLKVNKAGIKTIALPSSKPGLQPGKDYRFSVKMIVNPNDRSQDIVAQVWLEKVELSAAQKAKINDIADTNDRAIALAQEGVWFDSVSLLVQKRDRNSQELLANLLEQVGLEELEKNSK